MSRKLTAPQSIALGFSMHKNLYSNLTILRNPVLHQDYDCVVLIDGGEGLGKSVLGMQVAYMLDVDHHIDIDTQICYTPEQLKTAITTLSKGKAIIFDEARRGFNRRRSGGDVNLQLTDLFAECRQNNLFLIVIMPTFYDMDMNIAVWRSRALIHVVGHYDLEDDFERPLKRGFARFYTQKAKLRLYTNKLWRMQYAYPLIMNNSFDITFPHHYVVDEQEYRDKKRDSEKAFRNGEGRDSSVCPECNGSVHYTTKAGLKCHKGHVWTPRNVKSPHAPRVTLPFREPRNKKPSFPLINTSEEFKYE